MIYAQDRGRYMEFVRIFVVVDKAKLPNKTTYFSEKNTEVGVKISEF